MHALLFCLLTRFTIGSTETLNVPDLRQQLMAYYNRRYSSSLVSTSYSPCTTLLGVVIFLSTNWSDRQVVALQTCIGFTLLGALGGARG